MSQPRNQESAREVLQARIKAAFPDPVFSGAITGVDGLLNEELDEEQALYGALHGRRWPEIPASFMQSYPDSFVLLTCEAFAVFLPAWLSCALAYDDMRELIVYAFAPSGERSQGWMDRRISELSLRQKEILGEYLAYCVEIEPSKYVREHANHALAHVRRWTEAQGDMPGAR